MPARTAIPAVLCLACRVVATRYCEAGGDGNGGARPGKGSAQCRFSSHFLSRASGIVFTTFRFSSHARRACETPYAM